MKKLAIITTHPIQYQVPLFKDLKKYKIDAHVFYASKHGLISKQKDPEFLVKIKWNINSKLLEGYKSYFSATQKFKIDDFSLSFEGIGKYIKKGNYDALLVFGWNNLHYLRVIYFAKKNNIKIILRAENNLNAKSTLLKKILKYIVLKNFFKKFSYFLSIGKLNRKFYIHYGVEKKKILSAPYFVDNSFFHIKKNKIKLKKNLNFKHKKIVLFVGKLIYRKRPIDFLKLAKLNNNNQDVHFIMIGDGILKNECRKFIKNHKLKNLSLIGFVNQKKIREFYKISDLLILPSSYETWGLVINEAFASGVPVICTKDCGASNDLVIKKNTGYVYDTGNITDLSNKMNLILYNKIKIKNIKASIKKTITKFTIKNTALAINKILYE